jgi:hypothetical protein
LCAKLKLSPPSSSLVTYVSNILLTLSCKLLIFSVAFVTSSDKSWTYKPLSFLIALFSLSEIITSKELSIKLMVLEFCNLLFIQSDIFLSTSIFFKFKFRLDNSLLIVTIDVSNSEIEVV